MASLIHPHRQYFHHPQPKMLLMVEQENAHCEGLLWKYEEYYVAGAFLQVWPLPPVALEFYDIAWHLHIEDSDALLRVGVAEDVLYRDDSKLA